MHTTVTVLDSTGPMAHVSREMAHNLVDSHQATVTTNPDVIRFLSANERANARKVALRRHTGLAHPNDVVSDWAFVPGGEFDAFVAEIGEF